MPLWRLVPVAPPDDSRWQDRSIWSEVIVEAPTAAFARQWASEWALGETRHIGNESPSPRSGLEDEKLYWCRRLAADQPRPDPSPDCRPPVLRATRLR